MSASSFSESIIRKYASAESFRRGKDYYSQGAVLSVKRRGALIEAQVEGSSGRPYTVRCSFDAQGEPHASCTCPYDWGGWCKHVVAACLTILHDEAQVEERPTLETMLANLDRDQLQALLLKLTEHDPSLPDRIESLLVRSPGATEARPAPLTAAMIRRQVQTAFQEHGYSDDDEEEDYPDYDNYGYMDDEEGDDYAVLTALDEILDRIQEQVATDAGSGALLLLQTFTEEVLSEWDTLVYDTDEQTEFLDGLGMAWTEALLSVDLSSEERKFWIKQLDDWMMALGAADVGEVFEAAQDAAARGWDYPPLQRVLQGQSEQSAWDGDAPPYAHELTIARLAILERRGRLQEYLYLAKAERQFTAYMLMLVRVGRIDEALTYGLNNLQTADQAFTLVKVLHDQGAHQQSMHMAEHGLTLQGARTQLARWVSEEAAKAGNQELALQAATIIFHESTTLLNYLQVAELAGEQWPQTRESLLAYVREKATMPDERIHIFLHEGLIDEAIGSVTIYTSPMTIEKVVDTAQPRHAQWVIRVCLGKGEELIQQGSSHYSDAARWLARARTAYQSKGALGQWQTYLSELMSKHKRKYKLMDELRRLQ
jgi:uncharacterized Zn finger protein